MKTKQPEVIRFDLIELNGDDLRREPHEVRKATLTSVLAKAALGLRLNEHPAVKREAEGDWGREWRWLRPARTGS